MHEGVPDTPVCFPKATHTPAAEDIADAPLPDCREGARDAVGAGSTAYCTLHLSWPVARESATHGCFIIGAGSLHREQMSFPTVDANLPQAQSRPCSLVVQLPVSTCETDQNTLRCILPLHAVNADWCCLWAPPSCINKSGEQDPASPVLHLLDFLGNDSRQRGRTSQEYMPYKSCALRWRRFYLPRTVAHDRVMSGRA